MDLFLGLVWRKRAVSVSSGEQGHDCQFVGQGVVGVKVEVLVRVGSLPVDGGGQGAITVVSDLIVQKRQLPFILHLMRKLVGRFDGIQVLVEGIQLFRSQAVQVSSTYFFQNGSLDGKDVRALSSTSSMTRSATVTDTGDPIAVPNVC